MATVRELSDAYSNFMLNPLAPEDEDVCGVCLTFTEGYDTCYACAHQQNHADAVLPISYSLHFGQLHNALAGYKRYGPPASTKFRLDLAAVLWRFLERHERCLASTVGVEEFDVVVTVPSGEARRDRAHPLATLVGEVVEPTKGASFARLGQIDESRRAACSRFRKVRGQENVAEQAVLLVDDTWTTGASVQSAAGALKGAGAVAVGVIVVGRRE